MRVLVVGDLMVVVAGRVGAMARPGENVVLDAPRVFATGVATNVALCLRALDVDVTALGAVGDDALGEAVDRTLSAAGVDTSMIRRRPDAPTATMLVMVEPTGQRTMVGTRGASERFDPGDTATVLEGARPEWLHVSGYTLLDRGMHERCSALVDEASARGIPCSVDLEGISGTGDRWQTMPGAVAFGNLDEYRDAFGLHEVKMVDHPWKTLIVKAGADGCFVVDGDRVQHIATTPIDPVDSTGAGDAFDAAFIAASLRGHDVDTACRWGNEAGARAAGVDGPRVDLRDPPGPWSAS